MNACAFPNPLADRPVPRWFDDTKLGIFIHWGLFSVPGWAPLEKYAESRFAEEYLNSMSIPGSVTARYHAKNYGDVPYEAFVDQFRADVAQWDPEPWADLFERAGAGYVVLTTKIEDSFLMWPSEVPHPHKENWQVERDLVGELATAVRARGMRFGTYFCGLDYTFNDRELPVVERYYPPFMPQSDEWIAYADARWRELIERYEPSILWPDYGYPVNGNWNELCRWYVERVPDGVVNDRFIPLDWAKADEASTGFHHDFLTFEFESVHNRGQSYAELNIPDMKWEANREMGKSWGYNRQEGDADYASTDALIHELVDVVARGGNFLLNVGPTSTGEIPFLQAKRLAGIGSWLRRHGDAIYGTHRWKRPTGATADGIDVRYTATDDAVHAIVLGAPKQAAIELDVKLADGAQVSQSSQRVPLPWQATDHGTRIELPTVPDAGEPAIAFRLSPADAVGPR